VAYEAREYKQAGQTDGRADEQADGPNLTKISHSAILARKNSKTAYRFFQTPTLRFKKWDSDFASLVPSAHDENFQQKKPNAQV